MCNFLFGMHTHTHVLPHTGKKTYPHELKAPFCTSYKHIFQIKYDSVNKYFKHSIQYTEDACMAV